ncbi:MAG: hypothetical protein ACRD4M_14475, partial [Candidatus Acidiferrales bacterium]
MSESQGIKPLDSESRAHGDKNPPAREKLKSLWETWRKSIFSLREDHLFLILAVLIGIFSGLAVVCFRIAIDWTQLSTLGSSLAPSAWRVLLVPVLGGLVVAFLVIRVFPQSEGSGVNRTKEAVYVSNGYIPFLT